MKADEQNTGWRFGTTQYFFNFMCFFICVINIIPQEATNKPIKIILQPRFYFFTFESKKKKLFGSNKSAVSAYMELPT